MISNTSLVPALPGDAHLSYRDGQLCMEGVRLADLARAHGTPLFVYSSAAIVDALAAYQRGLAGRRSLICYALGVTRVDPMKYGLLFERFFDSGFVDDYSPRFDPIS